MRGLNNKFESSSKTNNDIALKAKSDKEIDKVLQGASVGRATKGRTTQYEKQGGFEEALKDFNSMELQNIQNKSTADKEIYIGKLSDGRSVNVRLDSSDGRLTLEIQSKKDKIKIRYGDKNEN